MEKHFGMHLRRLRSNKGVTLRKAAEDMMVSPSYLSKIEQNKTAPPSKKVMQSFARYYDVSLDSLVNRSPIRRRERMIRNFDANPNKAELFALYRMAQDIEGDILYTLLLEIYAQKGKGEEKLKKDLERFRLEFPRLNKSKEGLWADTLKTRFLSKKVLEKLAEKELKNSGIDLETYTAPTPIEEMIENSRKIELNLTDEWDPKSPYGEPTVLGLTRFSKQNPKKPEIRVSAKLFESNRPLMKTRLNFTLAHEYFHAIEHLPRISFTHPGLKRENVILMEISKTYKTKPSIRQRKLEQWVKSEKGPRKLVTDEDWREWQANYFAAALLMPRKVLAKEFAERFGSEKLETPEDMNIREYAFEVATTCVTKEYVCDASLSSMFEVSGQAMAIRLMQLKYVV